MAIAQAILAAALLGQLPEGVERIPAPADAVGAALAHCTELDESDRPFVRYVWVPPWATENWGYGVSWVANLSVSRSEIAILPELSGPLVAFDLRQLAPDPEDFAELFLLWERFANEPYFGFPAEVEIVENGQKTKRLVQAPGAYADLKSATLLRGLTRSGVPIVRADWFVRMALTTLEGGLYYDFIDAQRNPTGQTAQQAWFASFGVDEADSQANNGDERVAMFFSGVTAKKRRVDRYRGRFGRNSTGDTWITHDLADEDVDAKQDPIRNLLKFQDRAREAIATRNNGMQEFALFNNLGALTDVVPDNIAHDFTIPSPYSQRLQPGISCLSCHCASDDYIPCRNDVKLLIDSGVDIFGDAAGTGNYDQDLERLAGLYLGDMEKEFQRARDDFNEATLIATNGRLEVKTAGLLISKVYEDYRYGTVAGQAAVGPMEACQDLGYRVTDEAKAISLLRSIIPPLPVGTDGRSPADPIIGGVKAGVYVNRLDWEAVYADAAFRVWKATEK